MRKFFLLASSAAAILASTVTFADDRVCTGILKYDKSSANVGKCHFEIESPRGRGFFERVEYTCGNKNCRIIPSDANQSHVHPNGNIELIIDPANQDKVELAEEITHKTQIICVPDTCLGDSIDKIIQAPLVMNNGQIQLRSGSNQFDQRIIPDLSVSQGQQLINGTIFNKSALDAIYNIRHACYYVEFSIVYGSDPQTKLFLDIDTSSDSLEFVVHKVFRSYSIGDVNQFEGLVKQFEALNGITFSRLAPVGQGKFLEEHTYISSEPFLQSPSLLLVWSDDKTTVTAETGAPFSYNIATFRLYAKPTQQGSSSVSVIKRKWCPALPEKKL